jgi:hypothetical protein
MYIGSMFIVVATPFITYVLLNIVAYDIVSWIVYNVAKYLNSSTQAQYVVGGVTVAIGLAVLFVKGIGSGDDDKDDDSDKDSDDDDKDSDDDDKDKEDDSDKDEMEGGDGANENTLNDDADSDYSNCDEAKPEEEGTTKWMVLGVFIMMMGATVFPQINEKLGSDIYAYAILCVCAVIIYTMSKVDQDETSRKQ